MPCLEDLRLMAYLHGRFPLVDEPHGLVAQALGPTAQAALAACSVLSLQSPYRPAWAPTEDTGWLTALARWHMGHADEATLIHQLALHPQTLADMPRARITPAMVDAALAADPATVRWVPKRLMTPAHYAVALRVGV